MVKDNILQRIERNFSTYTKLQRTVASFVLNDPMRIAFLTVQEFANIANVSTATIVRFACAMGFNGYTEFQNELKDFLRSRNDPVKRLEDSFVFQGRNNSTLSQIYYNQIKNLENVLSDTLDATLEQAVKLITEAKHIYTIGARGSYSIAYYLAHHLERVLKNTDMLPQTARLPDSLMRIHPGDVLIVVNMPRYIDQIYVAAQIAHDRGAKIITITDSPLAPYAQISDVIFTLPCQSYDYHNTLLPAMLVAEMIISLVIANDVSYTRQTLFQMESISNRLGIFMSK